MEGKQTEELSFGEYAWTVNGWETTPEGVLQRHHQDTLVPLDRVFRVAARPDRALRIQYVGNFYRVLLLCEYVGEEPGGYWTCRGWSRSGIPPGVAELVLALAEQDEEPDFEYVVTYAYMLDLGCTLLSAIWEEGLHQTQKMRIVSQAVR